ncbi:CELL DIVISION PROTEIN KINASE [Salix koriyanagi]|uniref:CELL DIVISION PROTEIN KINASE n=1 Tax=Salix koriyanagi TaxID=2511006 RepID=A0A9Q0X053_9ROSI|nr:CELL DIVISION PROTEIN KINASE [Salix koriyanagi]
MVLDEFFTTKPLPCDPSSLPDYPPSKEFDAKMRDEEARRQGAAGSKGQKPGMERRGQRESRAVPAPDANAELVLSMQKRHGQSNSKSRSEKFNPHPEEVASGFPIDPPRPSQAAESNMDPQGHQHKRASHSGPLSHCAAWAKAGRNPGDAPKIYTGADLSTMSSLEAAQRSLLSEDHRERVLQVPTERKAEEITVKILSFLAMGQGVTKFTILVHWSMTAYVLAIICRASGCCEITPRVLKEKCCVHHAQDSSSSPY